MTKFIRKYQKQFLAVFGVVLMIIFIIPSTLKSGHEIIRRPIGTIGTQTAYADQRALAEADVRVLINELVAAVPFVPNEQGELSPSPQPVPALVLLGEHLAIAIKREPEIYFFMQQEAQQRGISVSEDQVATAIINDFYVGSPGDSRTFERITPETVGGQEAFDQLKGVIARFYPVLTLVRQIDSSAKVSAPFWLHQMASEQNVRVGIAEISTKYAESLATTRPATQPSADQIQVQYDKYKDVIPKPESEATDLNFGYKVPERVRVQYIEIPRDAVIAAVRATRSAYDWKVDAAFYYQNHLDEFVGPPPTSQPTTHPTTATTAESAPTTRPFEEVQEKATLAVLVAPADALADQIQSALSARLQADYAASRVTPTTLPADALSSKTYLDAVALQIQKQFNVLPIVHQSGNWLDEAQLSKLSGIGGAYSNADGASIATLIFPTSTDPATTAPAPIATLQPSEPLKDANSNVYIFRVAERAAAHTPPLADVRAAVIADAIEAEQYQAKLDAAKALLGSLKGSTLMEAANKLNLPHFQTATAFQLGQEIPGYPATPRANYLLQTKIAELRSSASASHPMPLGIVEDPAEKKVMIVQLLELVSPFTPDLQFYAIMGISRSRAVEMQDLLSTEYFTLDNLKSRLHFVPAPSGS